MTAIDNIVSSTGSNARVYENATTNNINGRFGRKPITAFILILIYFSMLSAKLNIPGVGVTKRPFINFSVRDIFDLMK